MASEEKYLRMTLNERIQHFMLLSTFMTLVFTGFALKYPEAFWVKWTMFFIGKNAFELRGLVHRVAAVLMTSASVYHLFYVIFTRRGRKLIADLWFYKKDLTDLFLSLGYLVGKVDEKPKLFPRVLPAHNLDAARYRPDRLQAGQLHQRR